MSQTRIRVLVGQHGLGSHDLGARMIARALRDAGMEVIYSGLHQTPEQIVGTAIQEDAEVIVISVLSGTHLTIFPRIRELLKEVEADEIILVGEGTIPEEDSKALTEEGSAEVLFSPGSSTIEIAQWIRKSLEV